MKRVFSSIFLLLALGCLFVSNAKAGEREDKLVNLAMSGDLDGVKNLLDQGVDVNAKESKGGYTALEATMLVFKPAYAQQYINVIKLLLARGADINKIGPLETTPLTNAAQNGDFDIVRILIDKGANVNKKDGFGHTALMKANEKLQEGIWDEKSSIIKPIYRPLTPAEKQAYTDIVRMLQAAGAK